MLILQCNNLGKIDLIKDTKHHNTAKHIKIKYLYIQNNIVQRNKLQIEHILGIKQLANILIKELLIDRYCKHCILIGLDIT
jgi:hypothetical protein